MKKSYIFAIGIIAIAIAIIISTTGDASSYVTFEEAKVSDDKVHVVGTLPKNENGEVEGIHPSNDKLSFSFIMVDEDNQKQEVYYNEPIPTDFKRSEQVVIVGGYQGNVFVADKILLKCPSKYQEENVNASI
ncbi:MAG: cytochrome c maturation protein CcmE [Cyclobacteriaceae bacterium]|nr:cytochrome c maturation protein CcmE [Cyclobacteriaceae bacterium]